MKVQCGSCGSTYTIDDAKIPDGGASAKCKKCGATIPIRKPAPVETKTAACPKCGRPIKEGSTGCPVCGVLLAKDKGSADMDDEALEDDERFRMSELTETADGVAGSIDNDVPEQFSSGLGLKVKEARITPIWVIGAFLILVVLLAFLQFGGERRWFGFLGSTVVTMSEYQKIENGMSYSRVAQIIGEPGEETGRNRIEDVPGITASVETVSFQWTNPDGSNVNAVFQNDKLITKAQFGLR